MKQLSENILDIAKNSVKAKASRITVTLTETESDGTLVIAIGDNGCGMDEQTLEHVTDPFYTTRKTRKVGLGLPFIKMQAEMTGGFLEIESAVGVGTTVRASFVTSHIDCPPLGNMPETIMTLIGGSPDIDFVFLHTKGEQAVLVDTAQIREVLGGDVPLDTPEVLLWVKEYAEEQYAGWQ